MSLCVAYALNRAALKIITRNNDKGKEGCVIWVAYRTGIVRVNGPTFVQES